MATVIKNTGNHPLIATVMVIDDQLTSRIIMETVLQGIGSNIKVKTYDNAITALRVAEYDPPDLILVDYKMPGLDGVEFTHRIRKTPSCQDIPIVLVTIVDEKAVMYEALDAGATDFLIKPIDHYECKVRCRNLLTIRTQQRIIKERVNSLESHTSDLVDELRIREREALFKLAVTGEYKDPDKRHSLTRIGLYASITAKAMGLDENFCHTIEIAAPLYDIGKTAIPDDILYKQGKLDPDEFTIVKNHTRIGYEILKDSNSPYLQLAASIALNHHERWDGTGYPAGIQKNDIPIEARIVAVVELFDVLMRDRPYRKAFSVDQAQNEIRNAANSHLDLSCVNAFFSRIDEILSVNTKMILTK